MAGYDIFPSILPGGELFVDDTYGRRELERMDYDDLRSIAAKHPSEDVNGRMGKKELMAGLEGLERI